MSDHDAPAPLGPRPAANLLTPDASSHYHL